MREVRAIEENREDIAEGEGERGSSVRRKSQPHLVVAPVPLIVNVGFVAWRCVDDVVPGVFGMTDGADGDSDSILTVAGHRGRSVLKAIYSQRWIKRTTAIDETVIHCFSATCLCAFVDV